MLIAKFAEALPYPACMEGDTGDNKRLALVAKSIIRANSALEPMVSLLDRAAMFLTETPNPLVLFKQQLKS